MTEVKSKSSVEPKPRFQEYECVILKKTIKGTSLKKGDKGAIMEVWSGGSSISYEVDFQEKKILECIPEKLLKTDSALNALRPQSAQAGASAQPPKMPEGLE